MSEPVYSAGQSPLTRPREINPVDNPYIRHLQDLERVFNNHGSLVGLGVQLDATKAIESAKSLGITRAYKYIHREDDAGVLHQEQLMTALDCIVEMLRNPERNGLVLGSMQSGKTTTSLALQFAGPIIYLLTGRRIYPIYLVTSHTSQEDQTKIELYSFLEFYGDLEILADGGRCTLIEYTGQVAVDQVFRFSPTIRVYREHVLRGALPDVHMGPRIEDFIQRRVHGQGVTRVAQLCRRANQGGFVPLLIIDEPQYGASDRVIRTEEGGTERRPCVLLKIFESIEAELGATGRDHVFIGLSATPYELNDVAAVWRVKQYLTPAYMGFNYFSSEEISDGVEVEPPRTVSFTDFGTESDLPFFGHIDLSAYDSDTGFARYVRRTGYDKSHATYRASVEATLRAAVYYMSQTAESTHPIGICFRLFNDNRRSLELLTRLRLDPERVEVISWFGTEFRGQSVKRAIQNRRRPELPFLVVVTNRARMGDSFPSSVEWFVDFARRASDLNALLQGLLGRACGYNKRSTVVLSDENAQIVADYQSSQGALIYKPSRHSLIVGRARRRGAPTSVIRVHSDMDDPIVQRFFDRLRREVVDVQVVQGRSSLTTRRTRPYRVGPILRIAEEVGLFEHLEMAEVRERLFPSFSGSFRIARLGDQVVRPRQPRGSLGYTTDEAGNVRFTFRWSKDGSSHSGMTSRGYGQRDAADRTRAGDSLEPQVHLRKRDAESGEVIFDKPAPKPNRKPGMWEPSTVILPLVRPVRELRPGEATLPVDRSPYSDLLDEAERTARDAAAARSRREHH